MSVSARETAGSPRDLLPGYRPHGGVPVRLPFAKRWCPKVDGIDFGTLSYPLQLRAGHRVFEGDNVRLLRSDSGDTSGGVARCCRPRPRARPTKCRAATTTHVRRWISSGKNTENPGFYTGKTGLCVSKICTKFGAPRSRPTFFLLFGCRTRASVRHPPPFDRRRCHTRSRAGRRSSATTPRPLARVASNVLARARRVARPRSPDPPPI